MTKAKGPLFSLSATHRIGKSVTYRRRSGTTIAQKRTIPVDARSPAQLPQRALFATVLPWWHALLPVTRETYRLIDPRVNYNAAYINFMRYQLMHELVDHHEQHQKGGLDETPVQTLDSATVGPSATPLYNIVWHNPYNSAYDSGWVSSYGNQWLDLSAFIPANAIAVLLTIGFIDTGSAGALAYGVVFGVQGIANTYQIAPHINNAWTIQTQLIGDITLQRIRHRVIATGVNTGRLTIDILAHIEPAEE